jgi:hypothetical protein
VQDSDEAKVPTESKSQPPRVGIEKYHQFSSGALNISDHPAGPKHTFSILHFVISELAKIWKIVDE